MGGNALTEGGALIHRSHRQQETLDNNGASYQSNKINKNQR